MDSLTISVLPQTLTVLKLKPGESGKIDTQDLFKQEFYSLTKVRVIGTMAQAVKRLPSGHGIIDSSPGKANGTLALLSDPSAGCSYRVLALAYSPSLSLW